MFATPASEPSARFGRMLVSFAMIFPPRRGTVRGANGDFGQRKSCNRRADASGRAEVLRASLGSVHSTAALTGIATGSEHEPLLYGRRAALSLTGSPQCRYL